MTSMKEADWEGIKILKVDGKGRVRVSRERREALLAEYDRSSMTGAAFAEWSGVKYPTLMSWLGKRKRTEVRDSHEETGRHSALSWVEAVVEGDLASGGGQFESGVLLEIALPGGASLRVINRESAALAAEVLRQLGGSLRSC